MDEPDEVVQQFCSQCGKEVDSDARFCKYCAFDLNRLQTDSASTAVNERLPSTFNRIPIILGSLAVMVIGLIVLAIYLRSNNDSQGAISNDELQSRTNRAVNSNTQQIKTNPAPPAPVATVAPPSASSSDGAPSEQMVEAAVRKAFGKLKNEGRTDSTPGIRVVGVQALSGMNGAKADVDLTNATFLQQDLLHGQWEIGPGGVGGKMVYPKKRIRIDNCTAMLKHYTNGRWVLESIDTHSYEFGVIKVNIDM